MLESHNMGNGLQVITLVVSFEKLVVWRCTHCTEDFKQNTRNVMSYCNFIINSMYYYAITSLTM